MRKKNYNILITCMGGYGSLSLLDGFMHSKEVGKFKWIGSHNDKFMLSRSKTDINYLVPSAMHNKKKYITLTKKIIDREKVDLFVPKSDAEVAAIYPIIEQLNCKIFLPNFREIKATQDKYDFYCILKKHSVPCPETIQIKKINDLDSYINHLPKVDERYWLRIKTAGTAGAYGASWIRGSRDAADWIEKWVNNHGAKISDFIISEYLPGRLFECILLFKNGSLKLAKVYENILFATGGNPTNFGIGSTPGVAKTASGQVAKDALKNSIKAVESAANFTKSAPNGVYHLSAKLDKQGVPNITEVNIGRPPSTIGIFNKIGEYNFAEYFLHYALNEDIADPKQIFDLDSSNRYIIRSLDHPLSLISKNSMKKLIKEV